VPERARFIKIAEAVVVDRETLTDTFGRFTFGPLARGWGWTMGTVLRRAMLSSVQGTAPTQLRIDGVIHEFSSIDGVLEDVPLIVLNVKKLRFKLEGKDFEYARLHATEPRAYTGRDLELPANLKLINADAPILTLSARDKPIHMEIKVELGRGYESQDSVKKRSPAESAGTIFLDAFYSPVRQVKIDVANVRYGERTDYEQVVFEITTEGSVTPEETLAQTAQLLKSHVEALSKIVDPQAGSAKPDESEESAWGDMPVESLEVPQTVKKVLADHGITTVAELIGYTEEEIIKEWGVKPRSFSSLRSRVEALGAEFAKETEEKETKEDSEDEA
jgi:DNA-directed RNA polymerase subunit alpha